MKQLDNNSFSFGNNYLGRELNNSTAEGFIIKEKYVESITELDNWDTYSDNEDYLLSARNSKETFITEWSVPIQIEFDQNLNYDFVVDWS